MTAHSLATAIIEFNAVDAKAVEACIERFGNPANVSIRRRLDKTGVIHFVSMSVVPLSKARAVILIELSADCAAAAALDVLSSALSAELQQIFATASLKLPCDWRTWFRRRGVRLGQGLFSTCGLPFDGSPAMSVGRIKREAELAYWIENTLPDFKGATSTRRKLTLIRQKLWSAGSFKWAFVAQPCPMLEPSPPRDSFWDIAPIAGKVLVQLLIWPLPLLPIAFVGVFLLLFRLGLACRLIVSFVLAVALLAAAIGILALILRHLEKTDAAPDALPDRKILEKVLSRENLVSQNILMTTSDMKPGLFRRFYLRFSFLIIGLILPLAFAPGQLGNISDIHFARWVLLPRSNKLVFRSNYDGSWLSYLFDFVQRAPQGVTMIWSNTIGFPRASWLFQNGATDGPRFLQWARAQTLPAPFWYSAYPDLSVARIRLHMQIARAVATGRLDPDTEGWLNSLGATSARRA